MSGTDNIEIVKGAYAAFGRGDLDSILASLTDDIDWAADTSSDAAPWYGIRHGKAEEQYVLAAASSRSGMRCASRRGTWRGFEAGPTVGILVFGAPNLGEDPRLPGGPTSRGTRSYGWRRARHAAWCDSRCACRLPAGSAGSG